MVDQWNVSPEKEALDAVNEQRQRNAEIEEENQRINERNEAFIACLDSYPGEYADAVEACNAQYPS